MSHTPLFRAGAAAALLCLAPSSVAASSLKAVGVADGTGGAARHEVQGERLATFELDTAIGNRLELVANLQVSAGVDIDYTLNGFSQGSADVIADPEVETGYGPER